MKKPSEPKYVAAGPLAKKLLEDIMKPATKEIEVIRKLLAERKRNREENE
ncbi:hypothetical protein JJB07_01010 [Tumebacillus sp. ITR2]|uniref:Uncharacterized protein n=1 Tax=Tumebacillus amylolyticus TaxID=2801339 RepID=A0ABS1J4L0_9BACL|nr:hypothetical protein [Tumebacillus amylolyticus]MBL0385210.1 hypothetical protein [Tumebacillus amylolyticus]